MSSNAGTILQLLKIPSIADFEILKPITRGGFAYVLCTLPPHHICITIAADNSTLLMHYVLAVDHVAT
jgi:hypothetical protein